MLILYLVIRWYHFGEDVANIKWFHFQTLGDYQTYTNPLSASVDNIIIPGVHTDVHNSKNAGLIKT